ncbi:hypothetical protein ACWGUL_30790, partial [Streptomyces albidoflavus]
HGRPRPVPAGPPSAGARSGPGRPGVATATRLDVRRIRLPRLPLAEQRVYGARFAAVAVFEESLRRAARLGGQLVQGLHDGLTGPALPPS